MEEKGQSMEKMRLELVSLFQGTADELLISAAWQQYLGSVALSAEARDWVEGRLSESEKDVEAGRLHSGVEVKRFIARLGK